MLRPDKDTLDCLPPSRICLICMKEKKDVYLHRCILKIKLKLVNRL